MDFPELQDIDQDGPIVGRQKDHLIIFRDSLWDICYEPLIHLVEAWETGLCLWRHSDNPGQTGEGGLKFTILAGRPLNPLFTGGGGRNVEIFYSIFIVGRRRK